jgi:hypothetical protein
MTLCDEKGRSVILDSKGKIKELCIVINADKGTIESETIDLYIEGLLKIINHKESSHYRFRNTENIVVLYKNLNILIEDTCGVHIVELDLNKYNGQIEIISPYEVKIQFNRFLKFYNNG